MIGITPEAFSFKGINCLAPNKFFSYPPLAVLLAYCTGILRTAMTSIILAIITTNHITNSIRIIIKPPLDSITLEANS